MDSYYLSREDWDSIQEMSFKPETRISTKAKSAFTRTYNKQSHPSPFSREIVKGRKSATTVELVDNEDVLVQDEVVDVSDDGDEDEDEEAVAAVKPKAKAKPKASSSKPRAKPVSKSIKK